MTLHIKISQPAGVPDRRFHGHTGWHDCASGSGFVLAAALLAIGLALPASARDATTNQRDNVRVEANLSALQEELTTAQAGQQTLDQRAENLRREINILSLRLSALRQHDTQSLTDETQAALDHLQQTSDLVTRRQQDLHQHQFTWATSLRILGRLQRRTTRPTYVFYDHSLKIIRSQRLMAAVAQHMSTAVVALRRELIALKQTERELRTETQTLSQLARTFQDEIAALEHESQRRRDDEAEIKKRAETRAARLKQLQTRIAALQESLRAVEPPKRNDDALPTPRLQKPHPGARVLSAITNLPPSQPSKASNAQPPQIGRNERRFSQLRGQLNIPVDGKVITAYGDRDPVGLLSKGITLEAVRGSKVTAPHNGTVMFAGPFRNYGQLLIIGLGEGYHMLLAGMSRIYPEVGQTIHKGQSLGEMGAQPDHHPTLYVELRRGGQPINPLPWMASNNGKVSG